MTAVGAAQVKANASVTQLEIAAESIIYSGGRFSNFFDILSYQIV
jgi:tripeptidyl-peptidase I